MNPPGRQSGAERNVTRLLILLVVVNLVLLTGSALFSFYYQHRSAAPPFWDAVGRYLLAQMHLGAENVLASWYSAMLLLLVALLALACLVAEYARPVVGPRGGVGGWVAIALIFAGLSLDEMGSLHEGLLRAWPLVLAIPIVVVAAFLVLFARRLDRRSQRFLVAGVLLLCSVPLQEGGRAWPLLRLIMEEGAEIFGMVCIVAALSWHLISHRGPFRISLPAFERWAWSATGILAAGLACAYAVESVRHERGAGNLVHWFPSATALIAGLGIAIVAPPGRSATRRWHRAAAVICVAASAYYGAGMYGYSDWREVDWLRRLMNAGLAAGAVVVSALLARIATHTDARAAWIVWGLLVAFSVRSDFAPVLGFTAAAVLLLTLPAHLPDSARTLEPL